MNTKLDEVGTALVGREETRAEHLEALVKRLEGEVGPDRELDAWIFCAVRYPHLKPSRNFFYKNRDEWGVFVTNQPEPGTTFHDAPLYTASIDAALTLLPAPDWEWSLSWDDTGARCEVGDPLLYMDGEAPTAPLAVCIAACKARIIDLQAPPGADTQPTPQG